LKTFVELGLENSRVISALALFQGFAHAVNGHHALLLEAADFQASLYRRFAVVLAAFAVPNQSKITTGGRKHGRRNFTGIGSAFVHGTVLSTHQSMTPQFGCHEAQVSQGHGQSPVHPSVEAVLDGWRHLTSQESTLFGQGVHFPIAQNKGRSLIHHSIIQ
jgi:hypothetical protein